MWDVDGLLVLLNFRIRFYKLRNICTKFCCPYMKSVSPSKHMISDFAPELKISSLHFNATETAGRGKCITMESLCGLL